MLDAVVDHLWQSTLIAAAAAGLAFALRRQAAGVRYWIWFAATLKFLVPFAALSTLGSELSWRVAEPGTSATATRWSDIAERVVQPMGAMREVPAAIEPQPERSGALAQPTWNAIADRYREGVNEDFAESSALAGALRAQLPAIAVAVWLLGALTVLAVWAARYRWLRVLARNAVPVTIDLPEARGIDIRMTDATIEPGLFGIRRPILLLPAGIADRLSRDELAAVIRHERCHLQRRDNLTALQSMLVAVLFWFYPVVWWVGARLVEERERACDEAVLAAGVDGRVYARGILEVCSVYVRSPLACAAGVGGGRLQRRIREILEGRRPAALGMLPKVALLGMPLLLLLLPFGAGLMTAAPVLAQSRTVDSPVVLTSEVFRPSMIFVPSLWNDTERPIRLFQAYRNESPAGDWFRPGSPEPAFGIGLTGCPAIRPFEIDLADSDIGPPPPLKNLADLVAYGFDLDAYQVVLPEPVRDTELWLAMDPRASIRHASCRSFVRRALEEDHALATRYVGTENQLVVERLDLPEPRPEILRQSLVAYRIPAVDVDPAILDAYTGYFARPYADSRFFAPVFEIRRQRGGLAVIWNEDSFVVQPVSESEFMATWDINLTPADEGRRNGLDTLVGMQPLIPHVSLSFLSTNEVRITNGAETHDPASQWDVARRVDAATAAEIRDDIQGLFERQQSAPAADALVREIVALLDVGNPAPVTRAEIAAGAIRSYVQLNDPGRIQLRGSLRSIALREVLPSGREIHDVVFDGLALQLHVGAAGLVGVEALAWDITCRRRNAYEVQIAGPCSAPASAR